jgi:hypothetical protein
MCSMKRGLAGLLLMGTLGCSSLQPVVKGFTGVPLETAQKVAQQTREGIVALLSDEKALLESLKGHPDKVQDWINSQVTYTRDEAQFYPVQCPVKEDCDYWAPVAHLLRSRREDCDGIIGLAHLALEKKGFGLYLANEDKDDESAHIVYVYNEKGKYGIVSVNASEYSEPRFSTLEEVANFVNRSHRGKFTFYKRVTLPTNDDILLYSKDGIEPHSVYELLGHTFKSKK